MNTSVPIELTNQSVRNLSFQVLVDIYGDSTYSCDITSYVVSIDNIVIDLQLRQTGSVLGKPSVNTSRITLDNTNGKFSPNNAQNIESEYVNGKFRNNTKVKILAGFIDSNNQPQTRVLFSGVITNFKNKITRDSKQMVLELKDTAKFLQKKKNPDHTYVNGQYYEAFLFNATISEAVNYLLDFALGTSYPRTIHTLLERLPIIEFPVDQSIWNTIQLLCQACEGRAFFENDEFKFYTPLSLDYNQSATSQYNFTANNIQDFEETIDEDNIINKWKISSNPKTLQARQVLLGTPTTNIITMVDDYWYNDGKSALESDSKTITLKSQEDTTWINSLNVPLVSTQTYSDFCAKTQTTFSALNSNLVFIARTAGTDGNNIKIKYTKSSEDTSACSVSLAGTGTSEDPYIIDVILKQTGGMITATAADVKSTIESNSTINSLIFVDYVTTSGAGLVSEMSLISLSNGMAITQDNINYINNNSLIKVWDRVNNTQLTVFYISYNLGKIILLNEINANNYNIQVIYQYYSDRILIGKYRWYEYELEEIGMNIEYPLIEANNGINSVIYSTVSVSNSLYLSDWTVYGGNKKVKFKLTNSTNSNNINNLVYITKCEIWGNAIKCVNPMTFQAIDGDTINQFENPYEISNDYIVNTEWGKKVVDYYLYKYKQNLTFLNVNTKGIPQIDLMDRVTITEAVSGLNFDFNVIGIKHSIKKDGWKTTLELESVIPPWSYNPSRVQSLFYQYEQGVLNLYAFTNPPIPTDISVKEATFVQLSGELITRIDVSFRVAQYSYYAYTLIQISDDNGLTFKDVGISNDGKYSIFGIKVGSTYVVRLRTVSINKLMSNPVDTIVTIIGKDTRPSDVPKLSMIQNGSVIKASITLVDEPDIRSYELRMGQTWENSTYIKHFYETDTTFEAPQEGTLKFMVKAIDNSGNYSENATSYIIDIFGLPLVNYIYERQENLSTWSGEGVYQDLWGNWKIKNNETLGQYGYFSSIFNNPTLTLYESPYIILPVADLGDNILDPDSYYFDAWGYLHLKTIEQLANYTNFSDIFNNPSLTRVTPTYTIKTFLGISITYNQSPNNRVDIQYRTRVDGDGWSEWHLYSEKQFFGKRIEVKLFPKSLDGTTNVIISSAKLQVDVPDVEDIIENVALNAVKTNIKYHQKFYEEPKSIAPFTVDNTGKQTFWRITNITRESFDLELLDKDDNIIAGKLIKAIIHGI